MRNYLAKKNHTHNNSGFTLVELLVSMTLTAIFATAVVAMMPAATRIYMQVQDMSRAQIIADMVVDALREECADTYIEDFASVRIINLPIDESYQPTIGDNELCGLFYNSSNPNDSNKITARKERFDDSGNVLIIRKSSEYCEAIYSCMAISYSNFKSVKDNNILEGTYKYENGISSRAVYRFFIGEEGNEETLPGYVHYGYYQCGKEARECSYNSLPKTVDCIYPAGKYDYTNPFSSSAYSGYTVSLEFTDLQTSSTVPYSEDEIYTQRPLSVKVTVSVFKCDYADQKDNSPIYTRTAILVFSEDTTK